MTNILRYIVLTGLVFHDKSVATLKLKFDFVLSVTSSSSSASSCQTERDNYFAVIKRRSRAAVVVDSPHGYLPHCDENGQFMVSYFDFEF